MRAGKAERRMKTKTSAKRKGKGHNLTEQERIEIRKERRGFVRDVVLLLLANVISVLIALLLRV